jgi:hypothetical protein
MELVLVHQLIQDQVVQQVVCQVALQQHQVTLGKQVNLVLLVVQVEIQMQPMVLATLAGQVAVAVAVQLLQQLKLILVEMVLAAAVLDNLAMLPLVKDQEVEMVL